MKKLTIIQSKNISGGSKLCEFTGAFITGWGLAGAIVGGVAAAGVAPIAIAGVVVSIYCASR
jgi:hypothetical protein